MESPLERLSYKLMEKDSFDKFEEVLKGIRKENPNYSTAFQYLFSLANLLEENGVGKHSFIGGYAVLAHLMQKFGPNISTVWRGSDDLDVLTRDPTVESIIRGHFEILGKKPSHIKNKYSLVVKDPHIEGDPVHIDLIYHQNSGPIKIDNYQVNGSFWEKGTENVDLYGVKIRVPTLMELLRLKLNISVDREKDKGDIMDIIDILSQNRCSAEEINRKLSAEERAKLKEMLKSAKLPTSSFNKVVDRLVTKIKEN